ncbi:MULTISPECIES: hypothetical protein [Sporosarcina]|uniref:hypothetical protein n=1 Tax=Sporosarcina TaxID=1569 RepID=UPI00058C1A94|nr:MULTISPECIES: hypothetical protein [Sporosarcina]WJY27366.1 hypothetical protein QWT68_15195 [Sporosarcina sp. 0.2-SM1T-5]
MFGLADLGALVISAFIIMPVVIFIRECGYLLITLFLGVRNPRLTVGAGPRLIQFGIFDIRKYYHLYSWFSFDKIRNPSNAKYIMIYAAPIITNMIVALGLNALIANGYMEDMARFWNRFIFYAFFYVLFDAIPMIMNNGKPNNGMIIYELLRYGKRVDYNRDNLIPSTEQMEEDYDREMKKIEEAEEKLEQEVEDAPDQAAAEKHVIKKLSKMSEKRTAAREVKAEAEKMEDEAEQEEEELDKTDQGKNQDRHEDEDHKENKASDEDAGRPN